MTADTDTLLDRRRLRRRLSLWRALAIAGIVIALFTLGAAGDRLSGLFGEKQIARRGDMRSGSRPGMANASSSTGVSGP